MCNFCQFAHYRIYYLDQKEEQIYLLGQLYLKSPGRNYFSGTFNRWYYLAKSYISINSQAL